MLKADAESVTQGALPQPTEGELADAVIFGQPGCAFTRTYAVKMQMLLKSDFLIMIFNLYFIGVANIMH